MGIGSWLKTKTKSTAATIFNPNRNNELNQLQLERYARNPNIDPNVNPNASDEIEYIDENQNDIPDMLEPRKVRNKISLFNPAKDSNRVINKDHRGNYVSTLTYPLPPVSWENKKFVENRRRLNKGSKFF